MRIKKQKNNQYTLAGGVWVRNPFCDSRALDINSLGRGDINLFLSNEERNARISHMQMDDVQGVSMESVVIASDGFAWSERQLALARLPNSEVKVLGVNGSLASWRMVGESAPAKRTMTFYVVNNPYPECMSFLPRKHRYYPNIVASTRTNPKFLEEYRGQPYMYRPTPDVDYTGPWDSCATMDDYRNPVCAAISLAVRGGARRILLLCCDGAFEDERPGAVRMGNGLFQYPRQVMCQRVVDGHLLWLKRMGIRVGDCSSGIEYDNAEYIHPEEVENFFLEGKDG